MGYCNIYVDDNTKIKLSKSQMGSYALRFGNTDAIIAESKKELINIFNIIDKELHGEETYEAICFELTDKENQLLCLEIGREDKNERC